mgnify:CR=1 FL=1
MKIMKRIKDILFDEEEVEIPVIEKETKKPEKVIEITEQKEDSIKEIKMPREDFSDKENLKSELTFPFPIEFDEEELEKTKPIENLPKRTETPRKRENNFHSYNHEPEPRKSSREIKDYSSYLRTKEEKKQFKPTPIISPVYGVLDQNYKKEDLVVKNEIKRKPINKEKLDLDEIRKKAYGETEEKTEKLEIIDLEDPIIDPTKPIGELMDESDGIETPKIGNTKDEPTVELNDLIDQKDDIEKRLVETNDDDVIDEDDADLFSLIDSMYEENNE